MIKREGSAYVAIIQERPRSTADNMLTWLICELNNAGLPTQLFDLRMPSSSQQASDTYTAALQGVHAAPAHSAVLVVAQEDVEHIKEIPSCSKQIV